ncbi:MAG: Asp-tRNA(Asn)/Glu-tRNA(Gln) amidotransferase subunit GatC [Candidatus Omnitrophica bacterium]|nr:Asp-tRNA(Asn)/Glu-tRNA(Gln) amidotransferase subunit GatC [Candidatus Omnitrophota bacterium]
MSVVTKQDVQHVARLARIRLEDAELATFVPQLDEILGYVRQLQSVSTEGVEPTSHVLPLANVTRPDANQPCLDPERALRLAPARHNQFVKVPKVIE